MKHDEESLERIYWGVALMTEGGVFDEEDLAKLVAKQYAENRVLAILNAELEQVEQEIAELERLPGQGYLDREIGGSIMTLKRHADYIKGQIKLIEEL